MPNTQASGPSLNNTLHSSATPSPASNNPSLPTTANISHSPSTNSSPAATANPSPINSPSANSSPVANTNSTAVNPASTSQPPATVLLVGIYNPTRLYSLNLPGALSRSIRFLFSLNSVSITGTCYSYKYPITVSQAPNGKVDLSINVQGRL